MSINVNHQSQSINQSPEFRKSCFMNKAGEGNGIKTKKKKKPWERDRRHWNSAFQSIFASTWLRRPHRPCSCAPSPFFHLNNSVNLGALRSIYQNLCVWKAQEKSKDWFWWLQSQTGLSQTGIWKIGVVQANAALSENPSPNTRCNRGVLERNLGGF